MITPPGEGGIGIIVLTGPDAAVVLDTCFRGTRRQAREIPPGGIAHGRVVRGGETVDEVIVAHLSGHGAACEPRAQGCAAPAGTRELADVYEVNCHGGVVAVQAVADCLRDSGAELARWQPAGVPEAEGSAVLSPGAIRATAIACLPRAQTRLAVRMLLHQAGGALSRALDGISRDGLRRLLDSAPLGRALLVAPQVALAGPPNVGKSTLLNALLRRERVIVHHHPGTTRDVVRETVSIRGVPFELIDCAGIRPATAEIEGEAVRRATDLIARSEVVILVYDVTRGLDEALSSMPPLRADACRIVVGNKIDLRAPGPACGAPPAGDDRLPCRLADALHLFVSAREGLHISQVEAALLAPYRDQVRACEQGGPVVFTEQIRTALERLYGQ